MVFKNTHNFTLSMLCFPNCKINLGLYITRRRADGYHDLETVFYPVPLRDALEVVPAAGAQPAMHLTGLAVAGNTTDNLVWKAYRMFCDRYAPHADPADKTILASPQPAPKASPQPAPKASPQPSPKERENVDIYLHKTIPMGAGLGGGSADGAFMLTLLNDYYQTGLTKPQLADMALQLGSDCPFFIYNTPQYASGRGEHMVPTPIDLSAYSLQLVCPQLHISTARAFQLITPRPAPFDLRNLHTLPLPEWNDRISNDFEAPVFAAHPVLASIKQQLYAAGAIYAALTGTGSTVYGIFPKGHRATIVADTPFESHYTL
jgi:4-diphosphocytidyl-2-C-methyl-D-erythritol kinase